MGLTDSILSAIRDNDLPRLRDLLEAHPEGARATTPEGSSPLMVAIYLGRQDQVRLLLAHDALKTVHEAAALGDEEALGRLLDADPDLLDAPAPDGFPPLHLAAHFARHDALELLLDRGADLHRLGTGAHANTALHAAAAGGAVATARILLASGADPDARDAGGNTPLHVAVANGAVPVVQALIAGGAGPEAMNGAGETPADLAARRGDDEILALLAPSEG